MPLYKYRSLENFKHFVDIILFNRIYAAPYFELNDPMEGIYFYNENSVNKAMVRKIKGEKERLGICSFSRTSLSALMWSHYANAHKGVVIELEVNPKNTIHPIKYEGPSYVEHAMSHGSHQTAINILTHKSESWIYEEESRVFVKKEKFLGVNITKVILGSRISQEDKKIVKNLIEKINSGIIVAESSMEKIV